MCHSLLISCVYVLWSIFGPYQSKSSPFSPIWHVLHFILSFVIKNAILPFTYSYFRVEPLYGPWDMIHEILQSIKWIIWDLLPLVFPQFNPSKFNESGALSLFMKQEKKVKNCCSQFGLACWNILSHSKWQEKSIPSLMIKLYERHIYLLTNIPFFSFPHMIQYDILMPCKVHENLKYWHRKNAPFSSYKCETNVKFFLIPSVQGAFPFPLHFHKYLHIYDHTCTHAHMHTCIHLNKLI